MLQRFATRSWQKTGYIAALILLGGGSFIWSSKSLAHNEEKNGNIITFNGNKFETGVPPIKMADGRTVDFGSDLVVQIAGAVPAGADSADLRIKASGDKSRPVAARAKPSGMTFSARPADIPLKMNGEPILRSQDLDRKAALPDGRNMEQALIESYMPALSKLPDGLYMLDLGMVIADATGKIVYYKAGGVDWYVAVKPGAQGLNFAEARAQAEKEASVHAVDPALRTQLAREMTAALESIVLNPAQKNGKPVIAYVESRNAATLYVAGIRNGKVTAVNSGTD